MTLRTRQASMLVALLFSSLACTSSGGQTGEEQGSCWDSFTPLALTDNSPLGFSPADVLALAGASRSATLSWQTTDYAYGPESGQSEIDLTLSARGGADYAADTGKATSGATTELGCENAVRVPVAVTLTTSGGALNEQFDATLLATDASDASFSGVLEAKAIHGSFAFAPGALGAQEFSQLDLNISFAANTFSGKVSAGISQSAGNSPASTSSFRELQLACWGSALPGQFGCTQ